MWESHSDTGVWRIVRPGPERALPVYTVDDPGLADRMVAAVAAPPVGSDGLEALLRCLLPNTPVPPKPIATELESLLQRLLTGVPAPTPLHHPGQASWNWRPCGRDRTLFAETGLRLCVSPAANRVTEWAVAPN